jgi:hypothetical protein
MDDEDFVILPATEDPENPVTIPAAPMGPWFWAVMAMLGVLILMIIYAQVQGVTRPVAVNLTCTSWTLASYADAEGTMIPATAETEANLSFGPADTSTLNGYAGCSWYSYTYSRNSTAFHLANGTSTLQFCGDPGLTAAGSAYLRDLNNISAARFRSGQLTFYDAADRSLLVFDQAGN